jgi:hypothetical protein
MRTLRVSAVLALTFACANPTGPTGNLTVRHTATALELTNHGSVPVYYFAIEQGALAFTDWVPVVCPGCPAVSAGQSITIADTAIVGYFPGAKRAFVYWWLSVPGPADAPQPDSVRAIMVDL